MRKNGYKLRNSLTFPTLTIEAVLKMTVDLKSTDPSGECR